MALAASDFMTDLIKKIGTLTGMTPEEIMEKDFAVVDIDKES